MGWTWIHVNEDWNGKIDRKKVMDERFVEDNKERSWEVVKSSMVGRIWYGALKRTNKMTSKTYTFAVVAITSTQKDEYFNFGYKDMDESMVPYYYDCPVSILKLLDETDDENSLSWRKGCYENHEEKSKKRKAANQFAEGDKIKTKLWGDQEVILTLSKYKGRLVWVDWKAYVKYKKKDVFNYPFERVS